MSRAPSAETELRNTKRELNEARAELAQLKKRMLMVQAFADAASKERDEWKRRFDLLLERTPKVQP